MLYVTSSHPTDAWYQSLQKLLGSGSHDHYNNKLSRDEPAVIEIQKPCIEPIPPEFPMSQYDIDIINRYIITGENESQVVHEWTKLYYHRIYDEPNNQYEFLVNQLKTSPQSGRAQISMWDKTHDQSGKIAPCTQIIWARQKDRSLEMHVHAASVDAYKKFLMNQQEFISFQLHVAKQLGLQVGKFYHFIDSLHIYNEDIEKVSNLVNSFA